MIEGTITTLRLDRGYGFIHANGRDVFFHANDLAEGLEFDELLQERRVEFEIIGTAKGPKAVEVRPVG